MGLSASQARFLQLTARKSNIEYQAQQINFERLQLSNSLSEITNIYEDKTTNRKITYQYNDGTGTKAVDLSYKNYQNYMNSNTQTADKKYFLVSTSGKLVVSSEEERNKMIQENTKTVEKEVPLTEEEIATLSETTTEQTTAETTGQSQESQNAEKPKTKKIVEEVPIFTESDFIIVEEGLDDVDNFQQAIKDGIYSFATLEKDSEDEDYLKTHGWETMSGGVLIEQYDTTDDAAAEAEYKRESDKIQLIDKKLEMELDRLESDRQAIQTEIESVQKVIDDNIESTFNKFS